MGVYAGCCHTLLLSILFFEIGPLTEPGASLYGPRHLSGLAGHQVPETRPSPAAQPRLSAMLHLLALTGVMLVLRSL